MGRYVDEVLENAIGVLENCNKAFSKHGEKPTPFEVVKLAFLKELKEYRGICDSPEKLKLIDELYLERCEEINRLKAELAEKEEEFCEWEPWDEEANCYHTSCENAHFFVDGSPKDNKHVFCPYCGRKIKEVQDVN